MEVLQHNTSHEDREAGDCAVARPAGFQSAEHRLSFEEGRAHFQRGGMSTKVCGARTRAGTPCQDVPLGGDTGRCLRHAGPKAARAHRERQLAQLRTGALAPEAFARAEARRARNALLDTWKKNPALLGATIDFGPGEAEFAAAAERLGVNVTALYPAVADWLRWRWQRHGIDCPNEAAWLLAVRSRHLGVIAFTLDARPHGLVAAALAAEYGIGVRNGCFCDHPCLIRLLGLSQDAVENVRADMVGGDRSAVPGLVRISFGMYNSTEDIDRLAVALEQIAAGQLGTTYRQDRDSGDYIAEGLPMDPADAFSISRQVLPGKTGPTSGVR